MSEAPQRIWACYDPAFDATYWVGPNKVYLTRHSVGEYVRADIAADIAADLLAALEACQNFIANTESELGMTLACGELSRAAIAKTKGQALPRSEPRASMAEQFEAEMSSAADRKKATKAKGQP